jgi:septal ring factor EnvC (AmiA/AmiB activator)
MAVRKSKPARPSPSRKTPGRSNIAAPTAAELPVTRAMHSELRTELFERIDQTKSELRAEIHQTKSELRAEIHQTKSELRAEIHEVKADVRELRVTVHRLEAGQHEVKAEMARVAFLVEEQNARNKVVLDALVTFMERQGRLEERMDSVEATVRALASPPSAG